ncbi:aldehyde dehydrogenase family protein [Nonomuraea sp. NPDC004297]
MTLTRDLLIGGTSVPAVPGRTTQDVGPATGEVYATVAAAGVEDVRPAVDAAQAPFGGFGASGYGRFGGRWALDAFTDTRWITLATQQAHYPF